MQVRCCCDASLIGWIDGDFVLGRAYVFPIKTPDGQRELRLRCATATETRWVYPAWVEAMKKELRVDASDKIYVGPPDDQGLIPIHVERIALASNDYPIEQLRQIPGFRSNDEDL